jgi:hypothetical protein
MHWTGKPNLGTGAGVLVETGWVFTDARGHHIRLPDAIDTPPTGADPTGDPPAAQAA